jgi:hypothetical protein
MASCSASGLSLHRARIEFPTTTGPSDLRDAILRPPSASVAQLSSSDFRRQTAAHMPRACTPRLARPLVVPGKFHANCEICTAFNQQLRYRQAVILELRHRMEDCRLPADARLIDCCAGIHVGPTVEEQSDRCKVAVFRSHMQKRSSLKQEETSAGLAAIEFRETFIHESGIAVNQLCQIIEPAAEQCQHSRRVVPGLATGFEKDVDAGAQSFCGTRV